MNSISKILLILCTNIPFLLSAQTPEKQISFAQESKPHEYYVKQAELWWQEVEKDKTSETNWFNYYRACRNAQGTFNWNEDFVKESPSLRLGGDIVNLMKTYIPNTFTYYYVAGSTGGIDPSAGEYLLKAYELNPNFEGIQSDVVTYAESISDFALRKRVNKDWFLKNELSPGLMAYGYNVLMSLDSNSVLLTQNDNDSYPIWMLQDVMGIRTDVTVINIDFLLLDSFREKTFESLDIVPINLKSPNINDYNLNWKTIVHHVLTNYKSSRTLYIGLTLFPSLYEDFLDKLTISGLAYKLSHKSSDIVEINRNLVENLFLLDYLKVQLSSDSNQTNVNKQNSNYLKCFKIVYDYYKSKKDISQANNIRSLAQLIAQHSSDKEIIETVKKDFN